MHLYNPSIGRWVLYTFSELNLSLSGQGTGYLSDVFLYDNNGVLTLELANWSSYSARAAALTQQDGVYVRSGALHKRYLGTIAMSATAGVSLDARQNRLLWNYYNRFPREIKITESAASWTLAGGSGWRPWNNNTANRCERGGGNGRSAHHTRFLRQRQKQRTHAGGGGDRTGQHQYQQRGYHHPGKRCQPEHLYGQIPGEQYHGVSPAAINRMAGGQRNRHLLRRVHGGRLRGAGMGMGIREEP